MGVRAAELFERHLLAGHRLDHVRPGDEHVRGALHHEDEVGDGRRIHRSAGARPHDDRDLRDHAGVPDVAVEDVAVSGEARRAFLDAGPSGIVDADDRRADGRGQVHDLADLLRHDLTQRPAEDREVLAEHEDLAALDRSPAGDDAVAVRTRLVQAERPEPMAGQHVGLHERSGVEQELQALSGGQLAAGVLSLDGLRAAAEHGPHLELAKLVDPVLHGGLVAEGWGGGLPVLFRIGGRARSLLGLCRFPLLIVVVGHSASPSNGPSLSPPVVSVPPSTLHPWSSRPSSSARFVS